MEKTNNKTHAMMLAVLLCLTIALGLVPHIVFADEQPAATTVFAARESGVVSKVAHQSDNNVTNKGTQKDGFVTTEGATAEANSANTSKLIEDSDTPLSSLQRIANWSLLDLMMTISSAALAVVLVIRGLVIRRANKHAVRMPVRLLSIVPAIVSIVLFLNTQNVSQPMSLLDDMSIWFMLCTVVAVVLALVASYRPDPNKLSDAALYDYPELK